MLTENLIAIMAASKAANLTEETTKETPVSECRYLWRDPKYEVPELKKGHIHSEDCLVMVFEDNEEDDPTITIAYRVQPEGSTWKWYVPALGNFLSSDTHLAWMFMPSLKEYESPKPVEVK